MITSLALMAFVAASTAGISMMALREHRNVLKHRNGLLDSAVGLLTDARISIARDQFPVLMGRLPDQRQIKIELIADTLVFRRLPQLWLKVTLNERGEIRRPTIGALARPTGAEFYSLVHDLPQWIEPPEMNAPFLMRGDGRASGSQIERVAAMFKALFSDPAVKEAVIAPRGVRLIRQAAQGDRGAHLLLRQTRFSITEISPEVVQRAIAEAEALSETLCDETDFVPLKLSA
jgi:hypothetical protein